MASPAVQRLRDIAKNVPVLNEQARQRQLDAQTMQAQSAIQQAMPGRVTQQAQTLAPTVQQAAQETTTQAMQQTAQQTLAAGQEAVQQTGVESQQTLDAQAQAQKASLQQQQLQQQSQLQNSEIAQRKQLSAQEITVAKQLQKYDIEMDGRASFLNRTQKESLASLGQDIKSQLFDSRLAFEKSERGRQFTNERQLADYALASSRSQQQLNERLAMMKQASDRDIAMLEQSSAVMGNYIEQQFKNSEQAKDQALAAELYEKKAKLDREIARKKARAANAQQVGAGIGTVVGAIIGAVFTYGAGTAVGAAAGAAVGGAAGSAIGSAYNQGQE